MKLFGFELIDNKTGKYAVMDIEKRIKEVYTKEGSCAAYATYRAITSIQEQYCKPLIKKWGGPE